MKIPNCTYTALYKIKYTIRTSVRKTLIFVTMYGNIMHVGKRDWLNEEKL